MKINSRAKRRENRELERLEKSLYRDKVRKAINIRNSFKRVKIKIRVRRRLARWQITIVIINMASTLAMRVERLDIFLLTVLREGTVLLQEKNRRGRSRKRIIIDSG